MQLATKRVLSDCFSGLSYLENIKIRLEGRVLTDIDLVVVEEATGTIFLCQLKHQELYGANLHAKQVRTERLRKEAEHWLLSIDEWVKRVGQAGIRQSFRLPRKFPPLSINRLVISRHYAFPLKELARAPDTTYANWLQLFNVLELMKQHMPTGRQLSDLMSFLKKYESPNGGQQHLSEPRTEWVLQDLKFTTQQELKPVTPK